MMTVHSGKQLLTILRGRSLISLIEECLASGDDETVNSLCKSMTQFLSNIPKNKRILLFLRSSKRCGFQCNWITEENWKSPLV